MKTANFESPVTPVVADVVADNYGMDEDLRLLALSGQLPDPDSDRSSLMTPGPPTLPAKRGPGRPRGRNYTKVSVFLDEDTIARTDKIAAAMGISRSEAIRRQLQDISS